MSRIMVLSIFLFALFTGLFAHLSVQFAHSTWPLALFPLQFAIFLISQNPHQFKSSSSSLQRIPRGRSYYSFRPREDFDLSLDWMPRIMLLSIFLFALFAGLFAHLSVQFAHSTCPLALFPLQFAIF